VVEIEWRSYPLIVVEIPDNRISEHSIEGRTRANNEESDAIFSNWNPDKPYPSSSIPAQIAVRCAAKQGKKAFEKYHMAVFKSFFTECQNIGDREVLIDLAEKIGLDIKRFTSDFNTCFGTDEIMKNREDYQQNFLGWGIPFALIDGRYPVIGGVPLAMYRRTVNLALGKHLK
jgi:predicted DsbA family dithiol-disulfide isomerase